MAYKRKTEIDHAWNDVRDQIRLNIRKVVRRLEDRVLAEADQKFTAAVAAGRIDQLEVSDDAARKLIKQAALELPKGRG